MKTNKLYLIILAVAVVLFSSCLKDSLYDDGTIQAQKSNGDNKFVEVHLTSADNSNTITYAFDNSSKDTTVSTFIPVHITSPDPASEDIKVTFQQLTAQDVTADATLKSLVDGGCKIPTASYSVLNDNNTVVIPKGERVGYIKVKITPSQFVGFNSVLAFKLTSVSGGGYTLSNLNTGYAVFTVKNDYDGTYVCNGYRIRPGNPTELVTKEERHLTTIDGSTVLDPKFGNYATYHVKVQVTNQTMTVGGVICYKVIATPVNDAGASVGGMYATFTGDAASLPTPPANPTEINYYNPITKTFVLNCYYTSSVNRIMYEVLVRK